MSNVKNSSQRAVNDSLLIKKRFEIEKTIRHYFWSIDSIEVRTPMLVKCPGMEPHIRPLQLKTISTASPVFLPTSPEFGMKKLLASGFKKIFQICPAFRDEPFSIEHHPEFTMLEYYEADISLKNFQVRIEKLFSFIAKETSGTEKITFRGGTVDLEKPWPRFQVNELFQLHVGIDLRLHQSSESLALVCKSKGLNASALEPWDDLYFKLWLNLVEPKLPLLQPVFVTHYPTQQSSLCNRVQDEQGFEWANRFEIYIGQLELGNAFDELRDPVIQRKNFERDQHVRKTTYGGEYPESPMDEELLTAISQMPPTCGIAIGVDRLCMVFLDVADINRILPLASFWHEY